MKLLRGLTEYHGSLKNFSVHADNVFEDVLDSGNRVDYDFSASMIISRPNKVHAVRHGALEQAFFYDGKTLTPYNSVELENNGGPLRWLVIALIALFAAPGAAQELSPRAYWPAPKGTRVVFTGYSYSWGDVLTDPSLPIKGVDSSINTAILGYVHTFSLAGRTSNVILEVPYTWGATVGTVQGEAAARDFSGLGDIGVTISLNLRGAPSMTPKEFMMLRAKPRPILGASVKVQAPTGEYDPDKLINIGTNRWSVKPELGYIFPVKPAWLLEFELGMWFFSDNHDFLGRVREQEPVMAGEFHLVKRIKPGRWVSLDFNYYQGGRHKIKGESQDDLLRDSRLGCTFAWLLTGRHAIKLAVSTGVFAETGSNYHTVLTSYILGF